MKLKDLIPTPLYEKQKDFFAEIIDSSKKEIKKRSEEFYILQKDVLKEVQDSIAKAAVRESKALYLKNYDEFCDLIGSKIPFIGRLISKILKKYKKEIAEVLFNG